MDILQIPFVGTYELRKNLPSLLGKLEEQNEGVVVTQKGKPKALLLSVKKYLEIKMLNEELEDALKELIDREYIKELEAAKTEIKEGRGKTARKVFKQLGI